MLQSGGCDAMPVDDIPRSAATATAAAAGPSALSVQLRGMRRAEDGKQLSVQRNVSEAFHLFIRRLDQLYESASAEAPTDFLARIDFWRDACDLAPDIHARLHRLRIWRNAAEHQDEQRWAREGPSGAAAAAQHMAALDARLKELDMELKLQARDQ